MKRKASKNRSPLSADEQAIDDAFGFLVHQANALREIADAAESEGNRLANILSGRGYRIRYDGSWRKQKAK